MSTAPENAPLAPHGGSKDPRLAAFEDRLRWSPARATVPGSLPVLFFGDLPKARVATVGLNPSRQEYLDAAGVELAGEDRRFESLSSLGVPDRASLEISHALLALERMRRYFEPGRPVYQWFRSLSRVMQGFGAPFEGGQAAHLDLVQEATDPVWSGLRRVDRAQALDLLARDLEFLRWQLASFELRVLVCTSQAVWSSVSRLCRAQQVERGRIARMTWRVGTGSIGARAVALAGWNYPLARPTGLTTETQIELGAMLRRKVDALGLW